MDNEEKEHQDIVEGMLVQYRRKNVHGPGIVVRVERATSRRIRYSVHVLWPYLTSVRHYLNTELEIVEP